MPDIEEQQHLSQSVRDHQPSDSETDRKMPASQVNPAAEKFPYCILWTPLPGISWFLPFIGHTGICDSQGVIHDFAGPYTIGVGSLAFGRATRYIQCDPALCSQKEWDQGVKEGCEIYKGRMHNLIFDNCHSHVARCLNIMGYKKHSGYDMVKICVWVLFSGKFVDFSSFLRTYTPFFLIVMIIAFFFGFFA